MPDHGWDAVVIGGGHNGLVAAAYLARAGKKTLVLERSDRPGGAARTEELEPGVRVPTYAHDVGRLRARVFRDLALGRHGLELIEPEVGALVVRPDGRPLALWRDARRTADDLRRAGLGADADGWIELDRIVRSLGRVMDDLGDVTPPDPKRPALGDAIAGLRLLRSYRRMGTPDRDALLRVLPMPVADFVAEHVADPILQGAVAFRGVLSTALGPMSAGTTATLLTDSGSRGGAAGRVGFARGGPGALTDALAAAGRAAGVEFRESAEVGHIVTADGRVTGVVLAGGDQVSTRTVVSAVDPKRLMLDLVDPMEVGPQLRWRMGNYRTWGSVGKVNLVLSRLPSFEGVASGEAATRLAGRIVLAGSVLDLERAGDDARRGRLPTSPPIEATIPTIADPSLAADGRHVLSAIVHYVPYRLDPAVGDWDGCRDALGDVVVRRLEEVAPGIGALVEARQVVTPLDLERDLGITGGHPYHGEPSLDQWFAWRPILELARYRTPIRGLYLAGAGSHPGGGITGAPGANAAREVLADL
jgi:phytoene dehydrogenase-like protein